MDLNLPALQQHILQSVSDGIHVIDLQGRVLMENAASTRLLGWCDDCLVGKNGHAAIHHHHSDGRLFPVEECPIFLTLQDGEPREVLDDVFWRQDGSSFPVEYRTAPLRNEAGSIYGVTVVFRDITERKLAAQMQAALHGLSTCAHGCESSAALYPKVERILRGVLPLDRFYVALQDGATSGLDCVYLGELDGAPPGPRGRPQSLALAVQGQGPQYGQLDGVQWLGAALRVGSQVIGALVLERDGPAPAYGAADQHLLAFAADQMASALERTQREARLRRLAQYDALTELPNRSLFDDRLQMALSQAQRRQEVLALVYIDLDRFKPVNDQFGHAMGDALLRAVAARLRQALRGSDTVARVGGDEFVALLHPVAGPDEAAKVAEKMRAALDAAFVLEGKTLSISASIGVALYPAQGTDANQLARHADAAMYAAKRAGSNRVVLA
ncbi:diguanylate cyclase (GGDEF)-like protein/PAS domain S-box-containing protein [Inhella inkyongensis]|uniref:Diguanylate cyclase (GGDEF)-like protein/PAS domain S-box-containing protein n=1 Tax=Inhella inkyongensis TaxID=392593 RepID=A0A840S9M3_9BURK|nr:diguanylate cyclase [Inhella inkyongensis]MBB5206322.1 diguanylate cyclase (GGDEF)-like protein/PAS domain S-box-containing protein [Inhella inkyongensis]